MRAGIGTLFIERVHSYNFAFDALTKDHHPDGITMSTASRTIQLHRWLWVWTLLLVLASCSPHEQRSTPKPHAPADTQITVLSMDADAMQGVYELVLRDRGAELFDDKQRPVESGAIRVTRPFPHDAGYRAVVHPRTSDLSAYVSSQPNAANQYELRVRFEGGTTQATPVRLDVQAVRVPAFDRKYHVIIITLDTLRADRLGCYGYDKRTSPNMDQFARQAVKYNNAYSTSSFTPPAHASLFTSRYVGEHGLMTWNRLPDDELTLAEVMSDHGYVSVARVNLQLLSQQGLGQGFRFQREFTTLEEFDTDGRLIVDDAMAVLSANLNQPLVMWLHFYDVHAPYGRQTEWTKRFVETTRPGIGDTIKHYRLTPTETNYGHNLEESGLTEADLDYIAARYDGGVAYVDFALERLFAALNTPQRLSDTMVVVTSDHGENLLERESCRFAHDPFLQSTVTRIPLLIRYPGLPGAGQSSDALVSLIDVAPTVFDVAGLPVPASFAGTSLVPLLAGEHHWSRKELYMESWGQHERKAVRSDRHLIIHDVKTNLTQLYDLVADPQEMKPMTDTQDPEMIKLYGKLVRFTQREVREFTKVLEPETIKKLRALGYIN